MLPLELQKDKDGLLYVKERHLLMSNRFLLIDKRAINNNKYYYNGFYSLNSTDDYIIKYSYTVLTNKEINEYKEMLIKLIDKQNIIKDIDFPIGYFIEKRKLAGLIIKYYKDGVSLDNISQNGDINGLGKYYYYDDDNIRNLFLLFERILDTLEEMFDNGICYSDVNPGNIVLNNNKVKVIDFDPRYVKFDNKDERLITIIRVYCLLLRIVLNNYQLPNNFNESGSYNFDTAKVMTKQVENIVRRHL